MADQSTRLVLIDAESEQSLTSGESRHLLWAAYQQSRSTQVRTKLAYVLYMTEEFSSILDLYDDATNASTDDLLLLCKTHLMFGSTDHDTQVLLLADRAVDMAASAAQRATALAFKGKALIRLGQTAKAREILHTALAIDPGNIDACKRLSAIELRAARPEAVVAFTRDLADQGISHARLFADQMLAFAVMGESAAARQSSGIDAFQQVTTLVAPLGFSSLAAFNAAVARELLTHPGLRFERTGSSSEGCWRVEHPLRQDRPATRALVEAIISAVQGRIASLDASIHPWAVARPDRAWLRCWSVISEGEGFESLHMHQLGWMSGVYYVAVPGSVTSGDDMAGCLAFGLPDDLVGAEAANAYGEARVRPQPGMLLTFPSHLYHRTYPHGSSEKRICFAFDVRPLPSSNREPVEPG